MEGKPEYQSETLEGVAADRFARDRAREDGERLDRAVAEAMNSVAGVRADRLERERQRREAPAAATGGLIAAFTGWTPEHPQTIRRAKARDAFYRRATALLIVAMICATALGVTWMLTR